MAEIRRGTEGPVRIARQGAGTKWLRSHKEESAPRVVIKRNSGGRDIREENSRCVKQRKGKECEQGKQRFKNRKRKEIGGEERRGSQARSRQRV